MPPKSVKPASDWLKPSKPGGSGIYPQRLYLDGTLFSMRIDGSIEKFPVLVAIGVTEVGHRVVLGLQAGDKESSTSWREMFKDLKRRGLDASCVQLGVMDGLPGLERVFKEEFIKAKVPRCQIHVARNVLAKVPKKLKKDVADQVRSIFMSLQNPKPSRSLRPSRPKEKRICLQQLRA